MVACQICSFFWPTLYISFYSVHLFRFMYLLILSLGTFVKREELIEFQDFFRQFSFHFPYSLFRCFSGVCRKKTGLSGAGARWTVLRSKKLSLECSLFSKSNILQLPACLATACLFIPLAEIRGKRTYLDALKCVNIGDCS